MSADYEQQRLHLLHKYGIDLESSQGPADGTRTRRLDRKEVERLMGGGDGQGGIFTWREKHGRKVSWRSAPLFVFLRNLHLTAIRPCALGSSHTLCKSLSELSNAYSVAHGARCVIYYDTTDAAQTRTVRAHLAACSLLANVRSQCRRR